MRHPNMKLVRKRLGYHILAFCIGAVAPLPFVQSVDKVPETSGSNRNYPDSEQQLARDAGAVRYVESRETPSSNIQDEDRYYRHNV